MQSINKMKILCIGDPHFQVQNIPEVNMLIDKLETLCQKEQPDLIVSLGDVLHDHERLHTIPLNKAVEFFDRLCKIAPTIAILGNHEFITNREFLNENHWMNSLKKWDKLTIVDKVITKHISGYKFVFCPYTFPGRFVEALDTSDEEWRDSNAIFCHQEFFGVKMGAVMSIDGDKWDEKFPPIISGHIHTNCILKNVYYPGSSLQIAFGESEKNIIPILTWTDPKKPYALEEIDLGLPRKKIVYTDINNIEELKLPKTDDKVKITLSGDYEEFKVFKRTKKYNDLIKSGTKVVFKAKKSLTIDSAKHEENKDSHFNDILANLIKSEKNSYVYQAYELIVNNKDIEEDEVAFV